MARATNQSHLRESKKIKMLGNRPSEVVMAQDRRPRPPHNDNTTEPGASRRIKPWQHTATAFRGIF